MLWIVSERKELTDSKGRSLFTRGTAWTGEAHPPGLGARAAVGGGRGQGATPHRHFPGSPVPRLRPWGPREALPRTHPHLAGSQPLQHNPRPRPSP